MERWIGAVAIVTGASAGIGEVIATELVKKGLKVVGIARRIERLNVLKNQLIKERGEFYPLKCDLTKEEDILSAFKWIDANLGPVDLLVNNAGAVRNGSISEGITSDWKLVLDLNLLGRCITTREAVKSMTANKVAGLIIYLNGISGHTVHNKCVSMSIYPATNHGITAVAETLRLELAQKKSPIRVSSISPGAVDTDILETGGYERSSFLQTPPLARIDIANAVLYLLSTPPGVNVTELTIRPTGEVF